MAALAVAIVGVASPEARAIAAIGGARSGRAAEEPSLKSDALLARALAGALAPAGAATADKTPTVGAAADDTI